MLKIKPFYPYIGLAFLLLIIFFLYFPVINHGWVTGTDQEFITRNPLVISPVKSNILEMFFSSTAGAYKPLSFLSVAADTALFPQSPGKGIHLGNFILHLLNVILFFRFVHLLSGNVTASLFMTALMAIHPLQAGAVAWMSSRGILLSTFFLLLSLLAYLYTLKSSAANKRHLIISLLFFILALFSHPIAVVLPFAMLSLDSYFGRPMRKAFAQKGIFFAPGIVFLAIAAIAQQSVENNISGVLPLIPDKILFAPYSAGILLVKFFFPVHLSAYHPYPDDIINIISGVGVFLLLLTAIVILFKRHFASIAWPLVFFILTIFIGLTASWRTRGAYGEELIYVAGMGIIVVSGFLLIYMYKHIPGSKASPYIVMGLLLAYISALAYLTRDRIGIWKNSESLWTDVIERYPGDDHAFFMRGDHYAMAGQFEKAKFDYQQCIRRNPGAYMALNNIGLIYMEEGDLPAALSEFNRSIGIHDGFYKSYLNKGIALMRLNRHEDALENMNRAASLEPSEALVYYNRGLVYERINALDEAIRDFSIAIDLNPYVFQFYKDRGKAYVWKRNFKAAEADYSVAISMDPSNSEMWFRRSLVRTSQDKFREGLEDALKARSLGFPVEEEYIRGISVQVFKDKLPARD